MSVVESKSTAPEIPDGLYEATIDGTKDITLEEPDDYGNTEKVEIQLSFVDSNGEPQKLDPRVNRKWGEKATLYQIALAAGCNVNSPRFDTDDLHGRKVNVLVETKEEGKWPYIKSWGRVKTKAAAAFVEPTPATDDVAPSVLLPTGDVDWTAFWVATKRLGLTRESVTVQWNGDIENLMKADGVDVAEWLQIARETAKV